MNALARLLRDENGAAYAAVEMILVLGLILLPLLAGIAQVPRWVDAVSTADLAAQEAARRYVLADSADEGVAAAESVVATIVANRGMDVGDVEQLVIDGVLARGETVTVTVTLRVPPVVLPGLGEIGGTTGLSRSATERVDDYRQFGAP
ncbi:MAG: TadE/TadG family type IV pilus assembly protein [Acidimicrobiia bacterium]|nr:TadE/TadG family type IV pilus assembly protein [Acidimicrobiia bacterium]